MYQNCLIYTFSHWLLSAARVSPERSPGRPGLPSPALPVCVSPLASPRSHSSSSDTLNTSTESLELSDSEDEVQQQQAVVQQAVVPIQATVPAIKRKSDDDQFLSSPITGAEKISAAAENMEMSDSESEEALPSPMKETSRVGTNIQDIHVTAEEGFKKVQQTTVSPIQARLPDGVKVRKQYPAEAATFEMKGDDDDDEFLILPVTGAKMEASRDAETMKLGRMVPIQAPIPAIKRKSDDNQFLSSPTTGEKIPAAAEHKRVRLLDPSGESVDEEGDEQISQDQSEKVHGAWRRQHLQTKAANAKRKKTATRIRRRKTVSCKLCSKVLCDKRSLSDHMASKHGISGSRKADADPSSSEDNLLCARNLLRGVACGACLRHAEKLSLCSGCHTVSYCGTKCQSHNWSRHKKVCKLMKDAKEEEKLSLLAKETQWFNEQEAKQKHFKISCQMCKRVVKDGVNCGRCSNVAWHKYCFKQLTRTEDVMCGDCCVVVEAPSDLPGRKGSEVTRAVDLHPLRAALPLPTSRLPTVGDVLRCANLRRQNSTRSHHQYTDRMLSRDVAR